MLPTSWLPGRYAAFSGFDGRTDVEAHFVLQAEAETGAWQVLTPRRRRLRLPAGELSCCTGDCVVGTQAAWAFRARDLICGRAEVGTAIALTGEDGLLEQQEDDCLLSIDPGVDAIACCQRADRWAIAWAREADEARDWARHGLDAELEPLLEARQASYTGLPLRGIAAIDELGLQAWSSLRVALQSPTAFTPCRWSTADRAIADCRPTSSLLHSLALNSFDAPAAWDLLQAVLEQLAVDGDCPARIDQQHGQTSGSSRPPLAWTTLQNYVRLGDNDRLAWALPLLGRAVAGWLADQPDRLDEQVDRWRDCVALATLHHVRDDEAGRQQWNQRADELAAAMSPNADDADADKLAQLALLGPQAPTGLQPDEATMQAQADRWAAEPLICAQLIATWRRSRPEACQALQEAFFRQLTDRAADIAHDHDLAAAVLLAWNPPA